MQTQTQIANARHQDEALDDALAASFPSSDAVSLAVNTSEEASPAAYNYARFSMEYLRVAKQWFNSRPLRLSFHRLETFDLSGGVVDWSRFSGKKLVIETASLSCPSFMMHAKRMSRLQNRYRDTAFIVVYVRENFPSARLPSINSLAEKRRRAAKLKRISDDQRAYMVDDLEGSFHRRLGLMPNTLWVLDQDGMVVDRAIWSHPELAVRTLSGMRERFVATEHRRYRGPDYPDIPSAIKTAKIAGMRSLWDMARSWPRF